MPGIVAAPVTQYHHHVHLRSGWGRGSSCTRLPSIWPKAPVCCTGGCYSVHTLTAQTVGSKSGSEGASLGRQRHVKGSKKPVTDIAGRGQEFSIGHKLAGVVPGNWAPRVTSPKKDNSVLGCSERWRSGTSWRELIRPDMKVTESTLPRRLYPVQYLLETCTYRACK